MKKQASITFTRKISQDNLNVLDMAHMPGFRITWNFVENITQVDNFTTYLTHNQKYRRYILQAKHVTKTTYMTSKTVK